MVEEGRGDTGRGAEKKIESSIKISKKKEVVTWRQETQRIKIKCNM